MQDAATIDVLSDDVLLTCLLMSSETHFSPSTGWTSMMLVSKRWRDVLVTRHGQVYRLFEVCRCVCVCVRLSHPMVVPVYKLVSSGAREDSRLFEAERRWRDVEALEKQTASGVCFDTSTLVRHVSRGHPSASISMSTDS